jgi:hypothetical protein
MSTTLSDKVLFAQFLKLIKENEMVYNSKSPVENKVFFRK